MKYFRILAVFVVLLTSVVATGFLVGSHWLAQPLPLPQSPFEFEVKSGASLSSVARELTAAGVLPHRLTLVLLARWRNEDRAIKAGHYEIEAGTTLPGLLAQLTQGDVTQTSVTIVEGSTFAELKQVLRDQCADQEYRCSTFPTQKS